jgi:hypothetical protein
MASSTEICNSALIKLGASRITALTDDSKEARICNDQYDKLRQDLLREHPWNFASKRATLAKTATVPEFEFDSEFQIPTDCLRVLRLDQDNITEKFKIESDKLLANVDSIKILYISDIADVNLFDANFKEALAWRLAGDLAYSLIQSNNLASQIIQRADNQVRMAKHYDAQEGKPDDLIYDQFVASRF